MLNVLPNTARSGLRPRNRLITEEQESSKLSSNLKSNVLGPPLKPRAHFIFKVEEWSHRDGLHSLDRSKLKVKLEPDM